MKGGKEIFQTVNPLEIRKRYVFPMFLKIVTISLFFSLLSLSLYIATFYTPRSFTFELLIYIGIILFGTSLFAAGSIVEPIERLKEGFEKIARGEEVFVELKSGDELESLADSFNQMAYEIKTQREVIKKSEEKYRALIEDINDWVFEINESLEITFSSSRSFELVGLSPEDVIGMSILDFVEVEEQEHVIETLRAKMPFSGMDIQFKNIVDGRDLFVEISGRPFFDENGRFLGYRCVARDITIRKRAEEEAAYLASILDHTIDAVVSLDLDTKIVSWNRGAEMMFGYTAEEMVGKPLSILIPPEREKVCAQNFRKAIQDGFVRDIEAIRISKDGRTMVVDQTLTVIHDSEGDIAGFVAIMRDITDRKRAEEALRLAYSELERKTEELINSKKELEYLANIVENSNDAIYSIDLSNRITSWNKTAERLFGWKKEEVIGKSIDLILPEELYDEIKMVKDRIGSGENITYETRRLNKEGEIVFVEITAIPVYGENGISRLSFIARDISTRLKAEKEMIREITRYNVEKGKIYLIEQSPDLCEEVISDLVRCGFSGYVFTREDGEKIKCNAKLYYFSERAGKNNVYPDPEKIKEIILKLPGWNNAVMIDLDYILLKNGFKSLLDFVQELRDIFYIFNKGVVIFNIDPALLSEKEIRLLRKECNPIEQKTFDLSPEVYEIARYVYLENRVGRKPSMKEIMDKFGISRNTAKKRIAQLVYKGLIVVGKMGRVKYLELTEKGRDYFIHQSRRVESIT
jgi:PAS domain S-box-containing protein